jgi:hypothetical protein
MMGSGGGAGVMRRQIDSPIAAVLAQIERDGDTLDVEGLLAQPERAARLVPLAALLDVLACIAEPSPDGAQLLGELIEEAQRRGWSVPVPTQGATTSAPAGVWLWPEAADIQHGQVWSVLTRSGAVVALAQIDGYETVRGRRFWTAINLQSRRRVKVSCVLEGSCPRIGGRRERARQTL